MARKSSKQGNRLLANPLQSLPHDTKRSVGVVMLVIVGIFLILAAFGGAGAVGSDAYQFFVYLLGVGYFLLPILIFMLAGNALRQEATGMTPLKIMASAVFIFAGLGFIAIVSGQGGF